ncbi:MAG: hypothetical protein RLO50_11825 [Azospirillaceae bacterium]
MGIGAIDLHGGNKDSDRPRRLAAAGEIGRACREIGGFAGGSHGVPATVGHACWQAARVFVHRPNRDPGIRCLPTGLAPGARPRHTAVTSGAYLMSKFRSTLESIDSELEDSDLEGAR